MARLYKTPVRVTSDSEQSDSESGSTIIVAKPPHKTRTQLGAPRAPRPATHRNENESERPRLPPAPNPARASSNEGEDASRVRNPLERYRQLWRQSQTSPTTSTFEETDGHSQAAAEAQRSIDCRILQDRNLAGSIRAIENPSFPWSAELRGPKLYVHFGEDGYSRRFLQGLRQLASALSSIGSDGGSDGRSLSFADALALMREASRKRRSEPAIRGTSRDATWMPVDCKGAAQLARERRQGAEEERSCQQQLQPGHKEQREPEQLQSTEDDTCCQQQPQQGDKEKDAASSHGDAAVHRGPSKDADEANAYHGHETDRAGRTCEEDEADEEEEQDDSMLPTPEVGRRHPASRLFDESLSDLCVGHDSDDALDSGDNGNFWPSDAIESPWCMLNLRSSQRHQPSPPPTDRRDPEDESGADGSHSSPGGCSIISHKATAGFPTHSFPTHRALSSTTGTTTPRPVVVHLTSRHTLNMSKKHQKISLARSHLRPRESNISRLTGQDPESRTRDMELAQNFLSTLLPAGSVHHRRAMSAECILACNVTATTAIEKVTQRSALIIAPNTIAPDTIAPNTADAAASPASSSWLVVAIEHSKPQALVYSADSSLNNEQARRVIAALGEVLPSSDNYSVLRALSASDLTIQPFPNVQDLNDDDSKGFIKSIALTVLYLSLRDCTSLFLWVWRGAMELSQTSPGTMEPVVLPDVPVPPDVSNLPSGTREPADAISALSAGLAACWTHIALLENQMRIVDQYMLHLRVFREITKTARAACDRVGSSSSFANTTASLDGKIRSCQTYLDMAEADDDLRGSMEAKLKALLEQKEQAKPVNAHTLQVLDRLKTWTAVGISEADDEIRDGNFRKMEVLNFMHKESAKCIAECQARGVHA